jgi:hypothetical protein
VKRQLWILLGIVAGVAYAVWALMRDDGEGATVVDKLSDGFRDIVSSITQGARVTNAPYSKTTGVVPGSPAYLAGVAGVHVEVYSLARNIASEEGNSSNATQAAVGWATKNYADAAGKSITSLLTHAVYAGHSGSYGTQRNIEVGTPNGPNPDTGFKGGSDRYASTALDPYEGHIAIAQGIIDGTIPDVTNGATQYDRPAGERDPDAIAAQRIASGSTEVDLSDQGVDPGLRFWTKV